MCKSASMSDFAKDFTIEIKIFFDLCYHYWLTWRRQHCCMNLCWTHDLILSYDQILIILVWIIVSQNWFHCSGVLSGTESNTFMHAPLLQCMILHDDTKVFRVSHKIVDWVSKKNDCLEYWEDRPLIRRLHSKHCNSMSALPWDFLELGIHTQDDLTGIKHSLVCVYMRSRHRLIFTGIHEIYYKLDVWSLVGIRFFTYCGCYCYSKYLKLVAILLLGFMVSKFTATKP